mgnify:CR=1 FL=1
MHRVCSCSGGQYIITSIYGQSIITYLNASILFLFPVLFTRTLHLKLHFSANKSRDAIVCIKMTRYDVKISIKAGCRVKSGGPAMNDNLTSREPMVGSLEIMPKP